MQNMTTRLLRPVVLRAIAANLHTTEDGGATVARSAAAATLTSVEARRTGTMRAWCLDKYGGTRELRCDDVVAMPVIRATSQVLVEVYAASVNPLDVVRTEGYGTKIIGAMRCLDSAECASEFPLILGRDFSGVVRATSADVRDFSPGDEVMGIVQPQRQGCHAEYVVASTHCVVKKPRKLNHVEAASIPYVGLTAWSSLVVFGGVREQAVRGRRALILGGAGGLGTFAIQLLKAWGMHVTTVVSGDAEALVSNLGADSVVDYMQPQWEELLWQQEAFDVILNLTTNLSSTFAMDRLKVWENASYIHTTSPLLRNVDALGWPIGLLNSAAEFGFDAIAGLLRGQWYRWGYVMPSKTALERIATLTEMEMIRPVVEAVFPFEETRKAYEKVQSGHARGKTVINLKSDTFDPSPMGVKHGGMTGWTQVFVK